MLIEISESVQIGNMNLVAGKKAIQAKRQGIQHSIQEKT